MARSLAVFGAVVLAEADKRATAREASPLLMTQPGATPHNRNELQIAISLVVCELVDGSDLRSRIARLRDAAARYFEGATC